MSALSQTAFTSLRMWLDRMTVWVRPSSRMRRRSSMAVALRQAADESGQDVFQPGAAGGRLHLCGAVGFLHALQLRGKVEILGHRHLRVEGRLFRQVAHAGLGGVGFLGQRVARHNHLPLGGGEIPGEDVHDGRFACAVRAEQAVDDAILHREGYIVHGEAAAVALRKVGYFYHKKRSFFSRSYWECLHHSSPKMCQK